MTICIVGHGQSMAGAGRGVEIDKYPTVRMKKCFMLMQHSPEDYGTRVDYVGGTTAALAEVIRGFPEAKEYWAYIKAKHKGEPKAADDVIEGFHGGKPVVIPKDLHFTWLERYYEFRGTDEIRYSTGTGLILVALDRLKPEKMILAGCDSIADPENSEHQSVDWSKELKRKDYDWENNPPHDYKAEHYFLFDHILKAYPCDVEVMAC